MEIRRALNVIGALSCFWLDCKRLGREFRNGGGVPAMISMLKSIRIKQYKYMGVCVHLILGISSPIYRRSLEVTVGLTKFQDFSVAIVDSLMASCTLWNPSYALVNLD